MTASGCVPLGALMEPGRRGAIRQSGPRDRPVCFEASPVPPVRIPWDRGGVKIYVAGPLADVEEVRAVQVAVMAEGHELTLDWTRGSDATLMDDYASAPALRP